MVNEDTLRIAANFIRCKHSPLGETYRNQPRNISHTLTPQESFFAKIRSVTR